MNVTTTVHRLSAVKLAISLTPSPIPLLEVMEHQQRASDPPMAAAAAAATDAPNSSAEKPDVSSGATEDDRPSGGAASDATATTKEEAEKGSEMEAGGGSVVVGGRKPAFSTSKYHGVTKHRWSGKYEAHFWDSGGRVAGRRRKGKQVYLGSYDSEEKAAKAHDLAALRYWAATSRMKLNFPVSEYEQELEGMKSMSQEECVASLRRKSSCFSRGASVYRGVTRRQKDGSWQARIGRVAGTRDIYLGTFKTEEEAAEAYDIAAIELRGPSAITNFDISNYCAEGFGPLEVEDQEQSDSSLPLQIEAIDKKPNKSAFAA